MSKYKNAVDAFYSLEPAKFPVLESLELKREFQPSGSGDLDLSLALRSLRGEAQRRLVLVFKGVHDLKFGEVDQLDGLFVEIRSIHDSQLEGLNYKVVESEDDTFSFLCNDFCASLESEATSPP